ncbi:MAG TPA: hypothetical protein VGX03_29555 [Candidatus Binatia bacterium]|jgi:hypothetical protein|nr:hypothetical protein [Candidatus Binatia bacterium]
MVNRPGAERWCSRTTRKADHIKSQAPSDPTITTKIGTRNLIFRQQLDGTRLQDARVTGSADVKRVDMTSEFLEA